MNKTSGGDGIPAELFQILKDYEIPFELCQILEDDAVKVLHSICKQNWKLSSGQRTGKCQFSFQFPKKGNAKNVQTTRQLHLFHMLAR